MGSAPKLTFKLLEYHEKVPPSNPGDLELMERVLNKFKVRRMSAILQQLKVGKPGGVTREGKAALVVKHVPRDELLKLFDSSDEPQEPNTQKVNTPSSASSGGTHCTCQSMQILSHGPRRASSRWWVALRAMVTYRKYRQHMRGKIYRNKSPNPSPTTCGPRCGKTCSGNPWCCDTGYVSESSPPQRWSSGACWMCRNLPNPKRPEAPLAAEESDNTRRTSLRPQSSSIA